MHTQREAPAAGERLTSEEVGAVRLRVASAGTSDPRAYGASTLGDVAEALGLPPATVARHLEDLRAGRAIRPVAPVRKDQRALLGFAVVLLASAYPLHLLNPRRLSAEEREALGDERLADLRARRRAHPVVHYPILTTVRTGALPPLGFTIRFTGKLTQTTSAPPGPRDVLPSRSAARAELVAAILNAYDVACEAERSAPKPTHPLPRGEGFSAMGAKPQAGTLVYSVGMGGYTPPVALPIDPPPGLSASAWDEEIRRQIGANVDGLLDGVVRSQVASLRIGPPRWSGGVAPPVGYSVAFAGRQATGASAFGEPILPYDVGAVARKLAWTVRSLMWHDADPPDFATPDSLAAFAKTATPAFAKVTFDGPKGEFAVRLPLVASPEYPTAADAARAANRILEDAARRAAEQVAPAGSGGAR